MTEIEALQMSWDMWVWLAETGAILKSKYPDFYRLGIDEMNALCPLCEYYCEQKNGGCDKCPLRNCSTCASLYDDWDDCKSTEYRKKYAQKIADLIKERLDGLKENKKMIKIRLEKWERALVMQVLEQDEELKELDSIFKASNGWELRSSANPAIDTDACRVYVRGDDYYDMHVTVRNFDSNAERDEYHKNIVQLFTEYNNRDQAEPKESEENIFVLR